MKSVQERKNAKLANDLIFIRHKMQKSDEFNLAEEDAVADAINLILGIKK